MKPIRQEDDFGCAVACAAFVLNISYKETLTRFKNGAQRVKSKANFYCPEITRILNCAGKKYTWSKLTPNKISLLEINFSIIFLKKSQRYPFGHFVCRFQNLWMDPWFNFPKKKIEAGFRDELDAEPAYVIYPSL